MTRATIFRPRPALCLLLATLLAVPTWAAAQTAETPRANQSRDRVPAPVTATGRSVDADWILQRLTQHGATSTPFVELRTSSMLKRPLQLSGEGRWVGGRLRFTGEARSAPEHQAALANLLNIIGRRQGDRSIITVG